MNFNNDKRNIKNNEKEGEDPEVDIFHDSSHLPVEIFLITLVTVITRPYLIVDCPEKLRPTKCKHSVLTAVEKDGHSKLVGNAIGQCTTT